MILCIYVESSPTCIPNHVEIGSIGPIPTLHDWYVASKWNLMNSCVTEISGKTPYREMRRFGGWERQPQKALAANQQPASYVPPGPICSAP